MKTLYLLTFGFLLVIGAQAQSRFQRIGDQHFQRFEFIEAIEAYEKDY